MTDARSRLLVRIFLGIAVLLAALVLLYGVAALRPTGYGELQREALLQAEARGREQQAARPPQALAESNPMQPVRPAEHWDQEVNIYASLIEGSWDFSPYVQPADDPALWRQSIEESAARILYRTLHWEAFPASFVGPFLSLARHGLDDLRNAPSVAELLAIHAGPPHMDELCLAMLEWRFVHAALHREEKEAIAAVDAWAELLRDHSGWDGHPWGLIKSIHRML